MSSKKAPAIDPTEEPALQVVESTPPDAERKTVEEWAILFEHFDVPPVGRQPIDVAKQQAWIFNATKHHKSWPKGLPLTKAEYEADIASMMGIKLN